MIWILCQKSQQIKLFCRKLFLFSIDPYPARRLVYFNAPDLNDIICGILLPISRSYRARCAFTRATSSLGENGFVT